MTTNNNREQIIALMDKANKKVQIAVSWLTDEILIRKMTDTAKRKEVEVLLSCDSLNVWNFPMIRELQKSGARVLKTGSEISGSENFMHAKFLVLDGKSVYGGSNNYTKNSSTNMENFGRYDDDSSATMRANFQKWYSTGFDYTTGFENPEEVKKKVIKQFEISESIRQRILSESCSKVENYVKEELSERERLVKQNIEADKEKERLRQQAGQLQNKAVAISKVGTMTTAGSGVTSKPHKFYGGSLLKTKFHGQKQSNSFSFAFLQKKELEKMFSFLKYRIENDTLLCRGIVQPVGCNKYEIKIEFRAGTFPQVYILSPDIQPNADIHIYKEGSLCLFYPGDLQWKGTTSIAEYTIPWIFEWIIYYELYLLTGSWEGDYKPHGVVKAIFETKNKYSRQTKN